MFQEIYSVGINIMARKAINSVDLYQPRKHVDTRHRELFAGPEDQTTATTIPLQGGCMEKQIR